MMTRGSLIRGGRKRQIQEWRQKICCQPKQVSPLKMLQGQRLIIADFSSLWDNMAHLSQQVLSRGSDQVSLDSHE